MRHANAIKNVAGFKNSREIWNGYKKLFLNYNQ